MAHDQERSRGVLATGPGPIVDRLSLYSVFFFQAEDGIRDKLVTGVQTCALPISITVLANGAGTCAGGVLSSWRRRARPLVRSGHAGAGRPVPRDFPRPARPRREPVGDSTGLRHRGFRGRSARPDGPAGLGSDDAGGPLDGRPQLDGFRLLAPPAHGGPRRGRLAAVPAARSGPAHARAWSAAAARARFGGGGGGLVPAVAA